MEATITEYDDDNNVVSTGTVGMVDVTDMPLEELMALLKG